MNAWGKDAPLPERVETMAKKFIGYRKFVQVGTMPGGRVQIFGIDVEGRYHSGEIVARQDRQVIANVNVGPDENGNCAWRALKLEMYADGSQPDFTVEGPAMAFIVSILPWDAWKVERFDGGTRWVPADTTQPIMSQPGPEPGE